jgi:ubiquinone/menaquinone biosynthesis C-methylase UbiE
MTGDTAHPWWQGWNSTGVADAIEQYWLSHPHEAAHRDTLVELAARHIESPRDSVLEVGCGTGLIYSRLVPVHIVNSSYVGVDVSEEMLHVARAKYPAGQFVQGDGYALRFEDETFDVTLCFEVLGHLPEVGSFLDELVRVTRRRCLFSVWPSPGADVEEDFETIAAARFLHRRYSDTFVRSILARHSTVSCVQAAAISAECWVYLVHKGGMRPFPASSIFPFRGYQSRLLQTVEARIAQITTGADERIEAMAESLRALPDHIARRDAAEQEREAAERSRADALARMADISAELLQTRELLTQRDREIAELGGQVAVRTEELEASRAHVAAQQEEIAALRATLSATESSLHDFSGRVDATDRALRVRESEFSQLHGTLNCALEAGTRLSLKAAALAAEVEAFRARWAIRWADRLKPGRDLSQWLDPAFRQLHDDSLLFTPDLRRFALRPSDNLQTVPFLTYPLSSFRDRLCGILLAPILTVPLRPGVLGIELHVRGRVVAQSQVRLDEIDERIPTRFEFAPVSVSGDQPAWIRVFVRDAGHPVRLFEWQRRRLSSRAPERRAFAGLLFAPEPSS